MADIANLIERFVPYRRPVVVVVHLALIAGAYALAFLLRFDLPLPPEERLRFLWTLPLLVVIRSIVFAWFHIYEGLWRYVSMRDILAMLKAVTLSSVLFVATVVALFAHGFARSVFLLDWVLCLALVGGVRLTLRAFRELHRRNRSSWRKRAIIVGAGDAGEMLVREIDRNPALDYEVLGFVDDDPRKHRRRIHGIEVAGTIAQLSAVCRACDAEAVLVAIPSAGPEARRRVLERCRGTGLPFKTVPALNELIQGRADIGQLREVRPEDLLGRQAVHLDLGRLRRELQGRRVLVTGAAGSIGSELCRQLATFEPEILVLFDRAESSLYFVDLELREAFPGVRIVPAIGDILDRRRVEEVIRTHAPDLVYHTAAYKHVPLMEQNPLESIANNVFGTETVALAAREGGVRKFVAISTDKAVRPVGIMGMTKRVAEVMLQALKGDPMVVVTVRFGNVLGSDGSVLPLFRRQIARGGPVTVTDPEASRYFMLPLEAVQLVLQAGAMGAGGEVFFFDMGEPVRILDLARSLVHLSGLEPGRNIAIEMIGLRPGERLREELVRENEDLLPTGHEKVFMVRNKSFKPAAFQEDLDRLRRLVASRDEAGATAHLKAVASRY